MERNEIEKNYYVKDEEERVSIKKGVDEKDFRETKREVAEMIKNRRSKNV